MEVEVGGATALAEPLAVPSKEAVAAKGAVNFVGTNTIAVDASVSVVMPHTSPIVLIPHSFVFPPDSDVDFEWQFCDERIP